MRYLKKEGEMAKDIVIKGARENNLKGIDITIPRDRMVVLTGLSGSGKSSLALTRYNADGRENTGKSLFICETVPGAMKSRMWNL